jgi:hypothetical protein
MRMDPVGYPDDCTGSRGGWGRGVGVGVGVVRAGNERVFFSSSVLSGGSRLGVFKLVFERVMITTLVPFFLFSTLGEMRMDGQV